jgi:hypothetical protein
MLLQWVPKPVLPLEPNWALKLEPNWALKLAWMT